MRFKPRITAAGIAKVHPRQHALAQHVRHRHGEQRGSCPVSGNVQHVSCKKPGIEHLIAERIATQPRAWLIEPLCDDRSLGHWRRQYRQHVVVRLDQLPVERFPSRQFLLAASMIVQRVGTDGDARAIVQRHGRFNAVTVYECAVGGTKIADDDMIIAALEPAMPTRDSAAFKYDLAWRTAPDGQRQQVQSDAARWSILLQHQKQMRGRIRLLRPHDSAWPNADGPV